jgi:predicted transcriptional regulator YheO
VPNRAPSRAGSRSVVDVLAEIIGPLSTLMPPPVELVVYRLDVEDEIPVAYTVAIAGSLTGIAIGDPMPPEIHANLAFEATLYFDLSLPDGSHAKSSTTVVHDDRGYSVAVLGVTYQTAVWFGLARTLQAWLGGMNAVPGALKKQEADSGERTIVQPQVTWGENQSSNNVDLLAARLLEEAIRRVGLPVSRMNKDHKVAVVTDLRDGGFFAMRGGVGRAAEALRVSRFTIYKYLADSSDKNSGE